VNAASSSLPGRPCSSRRQPVRIKCGNRTSGEFETVGGGTRRIAACTDYWSKVELGWRLALTANQHDAIAAIELALTKAERLAGHALVEDCPVDSEAGELLPVVTIVTDNGGPFRSARFAAFITGHPELHHVRTRGQKPGQNGVRERGIESLEYERLYREHIPRRADAGCARRELPNRIQHRPTARSARLEPPARCPPRPRRPRDPEL
jgi:hypothetical protein